MSRDERPFELKTRNECLRFEQRIADRAVIIATRRGERPNDESEQLSLYYDLSCLRKRLESDERESLSRDLSQNGTTERIFALLVERGDEFARGSPNRVELGLLCLVQLIAVCAALIADGARASFELISALLSALETRNTVIVDAALIALFNATRGGERAAFERAHAFERIDAAMAAMRGNDRGKAFVFGNYFAAVFGIFALGVASPRPIRAYVEMCFERYAESYEQIAAVESIIIDFIAAFARAADGAELRSLCALSTFPKVAERLRAAVRRPTDAAKALGALASFAGTRARFPSELFADAFEFGICATGDARGEAIRFFENSLAATPSFAAEIPIAARGALSQIAATQSAESESAFRLLRLYCDSLDAK